MTTAELKILVTGGDGQLGASLGAMTGSPASEGVEIVRMDRDRLDVTSRAEFSRVLDSLRPDVVVNGAAYTAVDAAESEPERATALNADAVALMAEVCRATKTRLVHISTDFVFGDGHDSPIQVDAEPAPLSVYGRSKLGGERACLDILGSEAIVVRTSWLYAAGHRNFVSTMVRLMRTRDQIGVVDDQVGTPTSAITLSEALLKLIRIGAKGVHHLTDSGQASWYEFAVAIQEIGSRMGVLDPRCEVRPISTLEYPTPATRPSYSVLDKSETFRLLGGPTPDWRSSLERLMSTWVEVDPV